MTPMKKQQFNHLKIVLFLFLIVFVSEAIAQMGMGQRRLHEKIEAQRVAFMTKELDLSVEEAQVFWPVYNEYNEKKHDLMLKHRKKRINADNLATLSEEELTRVANAEIENMEEMTELRRKYHDQFMEILPVVKVVKLYKAERDFNRKLFRETRGRMGPPDGRGGRGNNF